MEILKNGIKVKEQKKFTCQKCECEFNADYGEYNTLTVDIEKEDETHELLGYIYECICPNCGVRVQIKDFKDPN